MIITEKKSLDEICKYLDKNKKVCIVGCGACATKCQTGGDKEINELAKELEKQNFKIYDIILLDTPCDARIVTKDLAKKLVSDEEIQLLVCACGSGSQTIRAGVTVPVISGLNTIYIGSTKRIGETLEYCKACGDCRLMEFDVVCPVTRCPKGMVNGPCGGMLDGKCEVFTDKDCIWSVIFNKKKDIGGYKTPKKFVRKA